MKKLSVLISGAGIAGATLAHWLGRSGADVTVVEHSGSARSSGNPVDIRGEAMDVVRQMGVLSALEAAATNVSRAIIIGPSGRIAAQLPMNALGDSTGDELEVPRAELASILLGAARDHASISVDDWITSIAQDDSGVDVTFTSGRIGRFDLVVGADGQHSGVRRLVFGPEREFSRPVGLQVATLALGADIQTAPEFVMFNAPGRSVSIHPSNGTPLLAFIFWNEAGATAPTSSTGAAGSGPGRDDLDAQKAAIIRTHEGLGWRVPELLDQVRRAPDIYFDQVSQIRIDQWSRGRVALVGDAASSVTLLGEGSSLAIVGAHTLAEAIIRNPSDPAAAFAEYERQHRLLVAPRQAGVATAARFLVPRTLVGIRVRNLAWKAMPLLSRLRRPGRLQRGSGA